MWSSYRVPKSEQMAKKSSTYHIVIKTPMGRSWRAWMHPFSLKMLRHQAWERRLWHFESKNRSRAKSRFGRPRSHQPRIPSVASREEVQEHRTHPTKRTQGTMEATRERARPGRLGQPRQGMQADGDGCNAPEATTTDSLVVRGGRVGRGPQGVAGRESSAEHVGDPGGSWAPQGAGKPRRPSGGRLKTVRESEQRTGLRDKACEGSEAGAAVVPKPAQATWSGHAGLAPTLPTSLQGRAQQAAHDTSYRLRQLCGLLTVADGRSGWPRLTQRAASGGDRSRARASGARL